MLCSPSFATCGDFVGPGADGAAAGGIAVERPLAERRTADFQRHGRGFIAREGESFAVGISNV
ncbi:MAG: hypothetical protein ACLUYV_05275 [Alistipes shahii]